MQSKAATVEQYLAELPPDRRQAINAVREVFRKNLDPLITEGMQYGMIGYAISHSVFPAGYHCDPKQPLTYAGLASQKQHLSLYLMCTYGRSELEAELREGFKKAGKKLDMGKACIRFKKVEDLALDVIAGLIKRVTAKKYIEHYEAVLNSSRQGKTAPVAKKATSKAAAFKKAGAPKAKAVKKAVKAKRAV